MVFNRYLPHISGEMMSEVRVLSIFSIINVRINKKKTNHNEKYEIVLHTPHFNARCVGHPSMLYLGNMTYMRFNGDGIVVQFLQQMFKNKMLRK